MMDKDTCKVLDLLKFILEMKKGHENVSVYNTFVLMVAQQEEDLCWITDAEWADWFQAYADKLIAEDGVCVT